MTSNITVVTDSTADLPAERCEELGIRVVPLTVRIDGEEYLDGTELPAARFYEKLAAAANIPTTSQPSVGEFQAVYEAIDTDSIVSIHISEKLSGTYNSALQAAGRVAGKQIVVFDSGTVSLALGYVVQAAAEAIRDGASFDHVCHQVPIDTLGTGFYAVLETLQHAQKSGRVNFAQALLAAMLQVKPILTLTDGAVVPVDRPRTMRKAVQRLVELTSLDAPFRYLSVPHANNPEMAAEVASQLQAIHDGPIDIVATGAVVGTHCGPGAVATSYLKR